MDLFRASLTMLPGTWLADDTAQLGEGPAYCGVGLRQDTSVGRARDVMNGLVFALDFLKPEVYSGSLL